MGMVTFLAAPFRRQHVLRLPVRGWRTLRSLARRLDLPLRCGCGKGECGSCAVKVAVLRPGEAATGPSLARGPRLDPIGDEGYRVRLDAEEKEVLYRAGKLTREQYESETLSANPPLWRLACRYVVQDEDILVAL